MPIISREVKKPFLNARTKKNGFAKIRKNLALDTEMKINLFDYQNNYVGKLEHDEQCCKRF